MFVLRNIESSKYQSIVDVSKQKLIKATERTGGWNLIFEDKIIHKKENKVRCL